MIRRICLHAGPGCGKSTLAAKIFSELKIKGHNVELASEYVKTWAYEGKKPTSYDQLYVFAKQLHNEDLILRHCDLLVTDSPLFMNNTYAQFYDCRFTPHMIKLSQEFDHDFPSLNLLIERKVDYKQHGRYQTYGEAVDFDFLLKDFLSKNLERDLIPINVLDFPAIMKIIEVNINGR